MQQIKAKNSQNVNSQEVIQNSTFEKVNLIVG